MNIDIEYSSYGIKAIIKTQWEEKFLKFLLDNNVQELELNDGKGWCGDNVDFLKFLPNLRALIIIDFNIKSIDAIHTLNNLEKLQLLTYSKRSIDFNSFPNLLECSFEWIKGSESIFNCFKIKTLGINRYDSISSKPFTKLNQLKKLTIMNSKIENLDGIAKLEHLEYLSISNLKNLISIKGINELKELTELEIQRCKKIFDICEIFNLSKLERLLLLDLGDIKSINGIENLKNLGEFLFYESTNILDGDISAILKLEHLYKISFQNRKHYSHKREEFGKLYS